MNNPTCPSALPDAGVTDRPDIWEALRQIIDPELGFNIVDLGLIYRVAAQDEAVEVTMTLTTPGCPMHQSLVQGVRLALLRLPGISEAEVKVVWDPPWRPELMAEDLQRQLTGG